MALPRRITRAVAESLSAQDVARLSAIADREAGISLGETKTDFLAARLSRRLQELELGSYSDYCDLLERPDHAQELQQFLEAIATHTTSFFRERGHYDWLASAGIEELGKTGAGTRRDLTFWSAACSSGQELYTAMIVADQVGRTKVKGLRFRGVGTDLSREMISAANRAVYSSTEVSGIPGELRKNVLLSSKSGDGRCRIAPALRERTEWRLANLTKPATLTGIAADVAFLRNVLIYFDDETQARVIGNVLAQLRPGGYLMTGHSETALARKCGLTVLSPTIYRKDVP